MLQMRVVTMAVILTVVLLVSRSARSDANVVIVAGMVQGGGDDNVPPLALSLCYARAKDRHCMATENAGGGIFILAAKLMPPKPERLFVISEGQGAVEPVAVTLSSGGDGIIRGLAGTLGVVCTPGERNLTPQKVLSCMAAIHDTHALKVAFGAESLGEASHQLKETTDGIRGRSLSSWNTVEATGRLSGLTKPLTSDEVAWVETRTFCPDPDGQQEPTAGPGSFQIRGDLCEGLTVETTAGGLELVSLTDDTFSFDPAQDELVLSWPAVSKDVCLRAVSTGKPIGWKMRTHVAAGTNRFVWNLNEARSAHLTRGGLGIIAQTCDGSTYLPINTTTQPALTHFRALFQVSHAVASAYASVAEYDGSGARPPGHNFQVVVPDELRPKISVPIDLQKPGARVVTLSVATKGTNMGNDATIEISFQRAPSPPPLR